MNLNHINLGITEIAPTVAMLGTYFGLRPMARMPANDKMAFLEDDRGTLVSLFKVKDTTYPKIFHIGFMQETAPQVHAMYEKLAAGGFKPDVPREEHGRLTFYVMAPGGFMIEVSAFL